MKWLFVSILVVCAACKSAKTVTTDEVTKQLLTSNIQRSGIITVTPSLPFTIGQEFPWSLPHVVPGCSLTMVPAYTITYHDTILAVNQAQEERHKIEETKKHSLSITNNLFFQLVISVLLLLIVLFALRKAFRL